MQSVLMISPVVPDADGSGRAKRAHQWVHYLSRTCCVHLLVVESGTASTINADKLNLPVESLHILNSGKSKGWLKHFRFQIQGINQSQQDMLLGWYRDRSFDRLICFRIYLSQYAIYLRKISCINWIELDLDDLESETWYKIAGLLLTNGKVRKAYRHLYHSLRFYCQESKMAKVYRRIYVCSKADQAKLSKRFPHTPIGVFPNRLLQPLVEPAAAHNPYDLLFVGLLSYYPNEEAVRWFVREVMPKLRASGGPWRFIIAGYGAKNRLHQWLTQYDDVMMLGAVDRLEPLYAQAGQVVVPLKAGGGTKLKMIEAMLHGCPVVATGEAAYGLELVPELHYLPAETADEFANQCIALAKERRLRQELTANARDFMERFYVYEVTQR